MGAKKESALQKRIQERQVETDKATKLVQANLDVDFHKKVNEKRMKDKLKWQELMVALFEDYINGK